MPRNSSGNYTLPAGNPVQPETLIETAWANPTLADIAAALTDSLDRYGRGGMLGPFNVADGTVAAPGLSFTAQSNLGFYREATSVLGVSVAGVAAAKFRTTVIDLLKPVSLAGITGPVPGQVTLGDQLHLGAGTLAAPVLTINDTDSGFYSPSPGVIALVLDGVEVMRWTAGGASNSVPPGTMFDFGGTSTPAGYLPCNGSAISRTDYAALFAAIGTNWGAGDGSTTFNLPDMRRRSTVGAGGTFAAGPGVAVGSVGGSEMFNLSEAQLPPHLHTITDPGHKHGISDPGHAHAYTKTSNTQPGGAEGGARDSAGTLAGTTDVAATGITETTFNGAGITQTNATGTGAPVNQYHPCATVLKIIKF
ncbi:hypothetical protein GCM10028796_46660 [Ramlibacter monticola]|uniref:Tail fiber protein n=1 Tax=Ramlibacter monticola TaxID=1926872 RepID=A0A937CVC5_9BURK|nr:tail fiber protein [Ramlibacter monticola]MBL0394291.1 tail fiber protein [Ramlibacter monticola]